jgi:hypothetical protein
MKGFTYMTMLRWGFCLLAATMLLSPRIASSQSYPAKSAALSVGMVALLSGPQSYDGKAIQIVGVLCIEHENDAIYLHYEDAQHLNNQNALYLRLSESQREQFKKLNLKYVIIEGVMYANGPERSEYGGAIGNITRLDAWGPTTGADALPAKNDPRHSH